MSTTDGDKATRHMFTPEECTKLKRLYMKHKSQTSSRSMSGRQWSQLEEEFNQGQEHRRTIKQLRDKLFNIQKSASKEKNTASTLALNNGNKIMKKTVFGPVVKPMRLIVPIVVKKDDQELSSGHNDVKRESSVHNETNQLAQEYLEKEHNLKIQLMEQIHQRELELLEERHDLLVKHMNDKHKAEMGVLEMQRNVKELELKILLQRRETEFGSSQRNLQSEIADS